MGPRLDNEHRERGENARDRGHSHRHVESREQLRTALLQDAAEQGDGKEGPARETAPLTPDAVPAQSDSTERSVRIRDALLTT